MPALLKIAWRNLREHRAKTLIIGVIVALGVALLILGNSVMATAARGARAYFIDNYTGHLMIHGQAEGMLSIFGYSVVNTGSEEIPRVPGYEEVYDYLAEQPEVEAATPMLTGFGLFNFGEEGSAGSAFSILFGIEPASYRSMFPRAVTILEGRDLQSDEEGILISEYKRKEIREDFGVNIQAGDSVAVSGFGSAGFRVREVPVRGIFRLDREIQGLREISFIDAQSLRALAGITVSGAAAVELSDTETGLLGSGSPEEMFGEELVTASEAGGGRASEQSLLRILGERRENAYRSSLDSGAWHFLLVRLRSDRQLAPVLTRVNRHLAEAGLAARAVDWRAASGGFAALAQTLQAVFNGAILIIAVVAIIIIMNTLVISVMERTAEIGTMRALGAQKALVRRMFILETLSIAGIFGTIGIALASAAVGVLNRTGLPSPNQFFAMLFGGERLHPILPWTAVLYAFAVLGVIGIVASLYPVGVALKIQPVRAIQTE